MWNLDDMPEEELFETAEVLEQLARYARIRVQALRFQMAGMESRARNLECECERIYAQLPVWAYRKFFPDCAWKARSEKPGQ